MTREEFIEAYSLELERCMHRPEYAVLRLRYSGEGLRRFCSRFVDQTTLAALEGHDELLQLTRDNPVLWYVAKRSGIVSVTHLRKFLFDNCHIGVERSLSPEALVQHPLAIVA